MWVWGGNFDSFRVDYLQLNFYMHKMAHYFVLVPHCNCRIKQLRNSYLSAKKARSLHFLFYSLLKGGLGPDHVMRCNSGRKLGGGGWRARRAPLKNGCCTGVYCARERAVGPAPPRPRCSLTMMPVSRRNLDWTYSSVGTGNRGALECPIPGPASRRQAVCSQLGTPKPIPKLIVHALPSAPPLPGGHAFPPLTSVVTGPACF